jgi:predicted CopG family antitoxin
MATKNISITEEAYEALQRQKRNNESFTQIILRLTQSRGKLSDLYGAWKMTDEEETKLTGELSKGWQRTGKRMANEMR